MVVGHLCHHAGDDGSADDDEAEAGPTQPWQHASPSKRLHAGASGSGRRQDQPGPGAGAAEGQDRSGRHTGVVDVAHRPGRGQGQGQGPDTQVYEAGTHMSPDKVGEGREREGAGVQAAPSGQQPQPKQAGAGVAGPVGRASSGASLRGSSSGSGSLSSGSGSGRLRGGSKVRAAAPVDPDDVIDLT